MSKQPKRLNSRFPGTCNDCGAHVETGAPILWLRKNTIVCADCDAAGYDDAGRPIGTQATGGTKPATPAAGDWAAALAWNSTAPKPGESIGLNPDAIAPAKPAESQPRIVSQLFRDKRTGEIVERVPVHEIAHFEKYPGNCAPGQFDTPPRKPAAESQPDIHLGGAFLDAETKPADSVPAPVTELAAARIARTIETAPPELCAQSATVRDLLVVLINAIDRLDVDQCEALAAHCIHFANDTASGSRRRNWQSLARIIH